MADVTVLERVTRVCSLGLRFHDVATDVVVSDGLSVVCYPRGLAERPVAAVTSRSGVFAFLDLPSQASLAGVTVEVVDLLGRYLPFTFAVEPPWPGLFNWDDPSLGVSSGVPLFAAPAYAAPAGMAVVRAQLVDVKLSAPAAWAVLAVTLPDAPGTIARGVADADGRATIAFRYPPPPEPPLFSGGSTSGSAFSNQPLAQQTWTIGLQATYGQLGITTRKPDLSMLLSQPQAQLWSDHSLTSTLTTLTLQFGVELTARSGSDAALLISPAGPPL